MVTYLLDTNVISEPCRLVPNAGVVERLRTRGSKCAISAVSWHEFMWGIDRLPSGRRKAGLLEYAHVNVTAWPILPYDVTVAEWHSRERARLEARGKPMPLADGQIAATAVVHGLTLVTANVRDFRHVKDLRVENWWK
jgi:predicted nucleic acid-binding protein